MSKLPTLLDILREERGLNYDHGIRWGAAIAMGLYLGVIVIFLAVQFI